MMAETFVKSLHVSLGTSKNEHRAGSRVGIVPLIVNSFSPRYSEIFATVSDFMEETILSLKVKSSMLYSNCVCAIV